MASRVTWVDVARDIVVVASDIIGVAIDSVGVAIDMGPCRDRQRRCRKRHRWYFRASPADSRSSWVVVKIESSGLPRDVTREHLGRGGLRPRDIMFAVQGRLPPMRCVQRVATCKRRDA